jgi:ABC-type lipoprotein export system ATPase subunit
MSKDTKPSPESEETTPLEHGNSNAQKDHDMSDKSKDDQPQSVDEDTSFDDSKNDTSESEQDERSDSNREESAPSVSFTIVFEDDEDSDETAGDHIDTDIDDHTGEATGDTTHYVADAPSRENGSETTDSTGISDSTDVPATVNHEVTDADDTITDNTSDNAADNAGSEVSRTVTGTDNTGDVPSANEQAAKIPAQQTAHADAPTSPHNTGTTDPLMRVSSRLNAEIHRNSRLKIDQYPVLSLNKVTYFPKKSRYAILDNVDWPFYAGSMHTVLVDSDDARMSVMGLLSGLRLPSSGTVEFRGKNLIELEASEYRGHLVGVMFQQYSTRDELSALDNLVLTMQASGRNFLKPMPVIAKEMLQRVNFPEDRMNDSVSSIDLVDRRRAEIARTLCCDATVIMLDEPSGGLEHHDAVTIMKLLQGLTQENKRCIIVVTSHDDIAQYGEMTYEA